MKKVTAIDEETKKERQRSITRKLSFLHSRPYLNNVNRTENNSIGKLPLLKRVRNLLADEKKSEEIWDKKFKLFFLDCRVYLLFIILFF